MFEYLPEVQTVSSELQKKIEKKPLIVKLAIFRLIAAVLALAVMMLMRIFFPAETEHISEEFESSIETVTEGDSLISAAAEKILEYINKPLSEKGDADD